MLCVLYSTRILFVFFAVTVCECHIEIKGYLFTYLLNRQGMNICCNEIDGFHAMPCRCFEQCPCLPRLFNEPDHKIGAIYCLLPVNHQLLPSVCLNSTEIVYTSILSLFTRHPMILSRNGSDLLVAGWLYILSESTEARGRYTSQNNKSQTEKQLHFDLYMSINQHIDLEIVVVLAERIQHCFSNLNRPLLSLPSPSTARITNSLRASYISKQNYEVNTITAFVLGENSQ